MAFRADGRTCAKLDASCCPIGFVAHRSWKIGQRLTVRAFCDDDARRLIFSAQISSHSAKSRFTLFLARNKWWPKFVQSGRKGKKERKKERKKMRENYSNFSMRACRVAGWGGVRRFHLDASPAHSVSAFFFIFFFFFSSLTNCPGRLTSSQSRSTVPIPRAQTWWNGNPHSFGSIIL